MDIRRFTSLDIAQILIWVIGLDKPAAGSSEDAHADWVSRSVDRINEFSKIQELPIGVSGQVYLALVICNIETADFEGWAQRAEAYMQDSDGDLVAAIIRDVAFVAESNRREAADKE